MSGFLPHRIIVGAPRGTFPGGLNLPDPGEPAINRTGLIYSCTILPGTQCDAVRGDEDMFQDGDEIDNDGLHGAGRLFDHRRKYKTLIYKRLTTLFLKHFFVESLHT